MNTVSGDDKVMHAPVPGSGRHDRRALLAAAIDTLSTSEVDEEGRVTRSRGSKWLAIHDECNAARREKKGIHSASSDGIGFTQLTSWRQPEPLKLNAGF